MAIEGNVARSSPDVRACLAMRFRVYCQERGFLREDDYPDQMESDDFDDLATHLAILDDDGELLGTARLIRYSSRGFPLQRYCDANFPRGVESTTAEVSRLAVPRCNQK